MVAEGIRKTSEVVENTGESSFGEAQLKSAARSLD
jgi:hypothetical protein